MSIKSALTLTAHSPWSRTGILPRILLNSESSSRNWVFSLLWCTAWYSRFSSIGVLQDVCRCPQYDQTPNTHHPPYSFQSPEFPGLNSSSCGWSQLHETSCCQHCHLPKSLPCVLHAVGMIWLWYMAHPVMGKVDLWDLVFCPIISFLLHHSLSTKGMTFFKRRAIHTAIFKMDIQWYI